MKITEEQKTKLINKWSKVDSDITGGWEWWIEQIEQLEEEPTIEIENKLRNG